MIISFGDKITEQIWKGESARKIPIEVQRTGRRKLRMLNNSQDIIDLRIPHSNRLEKLKGKLQDFHAFKNFYFTINEENKNFLHSVTTSLSH